MSNRGTVIIHELEASNDITEDNGWEMIGVAVALRWEHEYEVIDADVSAELLRKRLERRGWTVLHEDDEFVYDQPPRTMDFPWPRRGQWVRKDEQLEENPRNLI
jgi:hypothetical protein